MSNKILTIGLLVAVVIAIGGYLFPKVGGMNLFGSTSCANITCLSGGLRLVSDAAGDFESDVAAVFNSTFSLGTNGTSLNGIIATTCTGIVYASLAATTTAPIDCAVTGTLTTAKVVVLSLPNERVAAGNALNLIVFGAHASSTPGYITAYVTNLLGVATTSYAQATTSMPVLVIQ